MYTTNEKPELTPQQEVYREQLLQAAAPKKRGRKPGSTPVSFAAHFKAFKETGEYQALYAAIQNREQFIEHLIYRAFQAGFKARK